MVPADAAAQFHDPATPSGIDRTAVRCIVRGNLAAVVSALDAVAYGPDSIAQKTGDAEWLAPRAVAHDSLITWASDRGPVVPFPMWVLFSGDSSVATMLAEREPELIAALERVTNAREFCVRIAADRAALGRAAETMDALLADLEQRASVAPPGEAYLLRSKLAEARKSATRDAAARIAEQAHDSLCAASRLGLARQSQAREAGVLLDGAYLVANELYDRFREVLTGLMAAYEPAGVRFDFTGPWPPYHFVRDD